MVYTWGHTYWLSDLTGPLTYSYEDWRTREQLIMTQRKYWTYRLSQVVFYWFSWLSFIIVEAVERFTAEREILNYELALITAGIGLVANTISASVLHGHDGTTDYNSHAAYLHVLSDALTEIGAIIGILCAMFWHITWIDSAVAVISALVVLRWAKRLLWDTGRSLTKA